MNGAGGVVLNSSLACRVVDYIRTSANPTYAKLEGFGTDAPGGYDFVDLTVEPQLVQDRAVEICATEPIRLLFDAGDSHPPFVVSRRDDFPLNLVHTSVEADENGRSLCIWEESWHDLRRVLTPEALIERIRNWFSRTASGSLHDAGQPLEPTIPATSNTLIIPAGPSPTTWHVVQVDQWRESWVVAVDRQPDPHFKSQLPYPVFTMTLPPQVHGALHSRPSHLGDLFDLVKSSEVDLGKALADWLSEPEQLRGNDRFPLIIITVPKQRDKTTSVEATEVWAFLTTHTLGQLGEAFGRSFRDERQNSVLRIPSTSIDQSFDSVLIGWRVVQRLDRSAARWFSGTPSCVDRALVAIGAGAIGSNVIVGTTRAGLGKWTIIDDDIVLPHNTVRQAHMNMSVGKAKADAAKILADIVLAETGNLSIAANILDPGEHIDAIERAVRAADLVVDFSASPAVLGRIADFDQVKRAASCFFNPGGADLVILAEDANRSLLLDEIEAQYFLSVSNSTGLVGHLSAARVDFIRYANACQDLSRPLPPWQVQTLCGIANGRLQSLVEQSDGLAQVWRLDVDTAEIQTVVLPLSAVRRSQFPDWRLTVTNSALSQMRNGRLSASPNETGGVLIGSFDLSRGVLHIVAALPAPPDSQQSPTYFVRGSRELKQAVDSINRKSVGVLQYVGEWHSHPAGAAARPSQADEDVFRYVETHLLPSGNPYIMVICGEDETWLRAGWQSRKQSETVLVHD